MTAEPKTLAAHESSNADRIRDLLPAGLKVRSLGRFFRICAVWRGDRSFDVAIAKVNGTCVDFGNGKEHFPFEELMKRLRPDDVFDPDDLNAIANPEFNGKFYEMLEVERKERIEKADRMWERGMKFFALPDPRPTRKKYSPESLQAHSANALNYLLKRGIPPEVISEIIQNQNIMKFSKNLNGSTALMTPYYFLEPDDKGVWLPKTVGIQKIMIRDGEKVEASNADGSALPEKFSVGALLRERNGLEVASGVLVPSREALSKPKIRIYFLEGFETGLAVKAATGMPIYCMYSSSLMQSIDPFYMERLARDALKHGKEIEFCAAIDNDKPDKHGRRAGIKSGMMGCERLHQHFEEVGLLDTGKVSVSYAMPNDLGFDWLDKWGKNKDEAREGLASPRPFHSAEAVLDKSKTESTPFVPHAAF